MKWERERVSCRRAAENKVASGLDSAPLPAAPAGSGLTRWTITKPWARMTRTWRPLIGSLIFKGIGSGKGLRGGCRVGAEPDACSPPNPRARPTSQRREALVNEDIPTKTLHLVRFRCRGSVCAGVRRGKHDTKRHTSGRALSTSEWLAQALPMGGDPLKSRPLLMLVCGLKRNPDHERPKANTPPGPVFGTRSILRRVWSGPEEIALTLHSNA